MRAIIVDGVEYKNVGSNTWKVYTKTGWKSCPNPPEKALHLFMREVLMEPLRPKYKPPVSVIREWVTQRKQDAERLEG